MIKKCRWLRSIIKPGLSVAAPLLLLAATASAQTVGNGFSLGIGGGFAQGSSSPGVSSRFGYYILSTLELPSPIRVMRPRADLFFADWGQNVMGLTANVLVTPLSSKRAVPYALAGAGAFSMPGSNPKAGWTLGLGLRLPGELRSVVIESRMHAYLRGHGPEFGSSRWRYLYSPIGLGVQF